MRTLFHLAHEHVDFRIPVSIEYEDDLKFLNNVELSSILKIVSIYHCLFSQK